MCNEAFFYILIFILCLSFSFKSSLDIYRSLKDIAEKKKSIKRSEDDFEEQLLKRKNERNGMA